MFRKQNILKFLLLSVLLLACACAGPRVADKPSSPTNNTAAVNSPSPTNQVTSTNRVLSTDEIAPTDTILLTDTITPTNTVKLTNTPKPTHQVIVAVNTVRPTRRVIPTRQPAPTNIPKPTNTPKPTQTATPTRTPLPTKTATPDRLATARAFIKHIVIIMQENRSFDHYFGTYPGADGIPMRNGVPSVCVDDPKTEKCLKPFHDSADINFGGSHTAKAAAADINGGKMDGFLKSVFYGRHSCPNPNAPGCSILNPKVPDAIGWHDAREIPNYWAYAHHFVLHDRMFEPTSSWSLPQHLFMVSGWSASCRTPFNPMSCVSDLDTPGRGLLAGGTKVDYAWTDLTYLLYKKHVSWGYYLTEGVEPDCEDDDMFCKSVPSRLSVPGIWNPLPNFADVHLTHQLDHIQQTERFYEALENGTLPAVSWIVPENGISEHPPASVHAGQSYVTGLINAIMQSPDWNSTVIFLSWDDWGGFYDHVSPPRVDENGYGLRVPSLMISPYAKRGLIDHQILSHDAYLKFIEDIFLGGQRLDPRTDGRPDSRPTVRENIPLLGDLLKDFNFSQQPLPKLILPVDPPPGPASMPGP